MLLPFAAVVVENMRTMEDDTIIIRVREEPSVFAAPE
jgi:hypothetical protein